MHTHLSHVLLRGEHQLKVDQPFGQLLEEAAVWVHVHRLLMLHRLVHPTLGQARRVVEVPRSDCLRGEGIGGRLSLADNGYCRMVARQATSETFISPIHTITPV